LHAPVLDAELPHVDVGRPDAEGGEDGADLAAVIGAVVKRLGETNPGRGAVRGAVGTLTDDHAVRIIELRANTRPRRAVQLHHRSSGSEAPALFHGAIHAASGQPGQVSAV